MRGYRAVEPSVGVIPKEARGPLGVIKWRGDVKLMEANQDERRLQEHE